MDKMQSFVTYLEKTAPQRLQRKFIDQITHGIPDIIYVLDLEARRIIFINDRVSSILGLAPEEIYKLGATFFIKKLHPDDYLKRMQHITECRDMQENETKTIDVRFRMNDGRWRWFRVRDIAFQFSNGKVTQTVGVARDIEELKHAEEEIRNKESLLYTIINLIPNPVQAFKVIRNEQGKITDFEWIVVNEAMEYTGQVVGKSLIKKYPGVIPSGLFEKYKHVVETGTPLRTSLFYGYDNLNKWMNVFAAKMEDGLVVLIYDVPEENKDEPKARRN